MSKKLPHTFKKGRRSPAKKTSRCGAQQPHRFRPRFELLEDRTLLTANLFLDFGDVFPTGGLVMTVQQLRNNFGATPAGLQGPDLRQADNPATMPLNEAITDATNLVFNPTAPLVTFDYNNDGLPNNTDYTGLRANVLTLVQRYYAPFDVNVQIAPAVDNSSSANYMVGVRAQLQAGANVNGERDSWVFIANVLRQGDNLSIGNLTSNNGISNGTDIGGNNANDNCEIAYADQILGAVNPGGNDADTRLAYTAAHEAAHDFGLQHTRRGLSTNVAGVNSGAAGTASFVVAGDTRPDVFPGESIVVTGSTGNDGTYTITGEAFASGPNQTTISVAQAVNNATADGLITDGRGAFIISRSDLIVGSAPFFNRVNFDSFSRFTLYTDSAAPLTVNNYDRLANNNNLGLTAGFPAYFTGTGAFDRITVNSAGVNQANVTVQAYRDAAFTTLLDTYTQNGINISNGILIDCGLNNDLVVLDGDLGATVTVRGMGGTDRLQIMGKSAASGTYTPGTNNVNGLDDNPDLRGTITIGSTTVQFQEFETAGGVTVQDVSSLTLRTPLSNDSLTLASAAASQNMITGTTGGVGIVPLTFFNVAGMTIDAGTNDGGLPGDIVNVTSSIVASGLQNFTVSTGAGDDELFTNLSNYALPAGGGSFRYEGGAGSDEIQATANVSFNLSDTSLAIVGDSSIILSSVNEAELTGGNGANTLTVSNWSGAAVLDGVGAGDSYIVNLKGFDGGSVDIADFGLSGDDSAVVNATAAVDTLDVTSILVTRGGETVAYSGLEGLTINALGEDDNINVQSTAASTPVTVNGGDDDDTFNIGNALNSLDDILGAVTVNGNDPTASDALNVNDQGDADPHGYIVTSTTVERDGAAAITYGTVESLTLNGGGGGNLINVQSTAAGTVVVVNAGASDDDVTVDSNGGPLDPPDGTVNFVVSSLTINGQGGINTLRLEDFSDPNLDTGDVVHVTPTQIGADPADNFFGTGGSLTYSGLAHITLDLSNGYFPDTVYLIPSATTAFELHGNDPDCPMNPDQLPGDALYVDFTGVTDPLLLADGEGNATWTFGNREDVAFDGFEKLNHVGIIVVAPDMGQEALVRVFDAETGAEKFSFQPFEAAFHGGIRVAVGDANCDGIPDIITAAGPGRAPEVRVFNGASGLPLAGTLGSFLAYDAGSMSGVWVAAGDINQDGFTDIVTGPDNGGGPPLVKVFTGETGLLHAQFNAYPTKFQGGVRVAVGDINGDIFPDVVTAPGPGRAPQVRVFDGLNLTDPPINSFLAFANNYRLGLYLAVGDINGDGRADIVAGGGAGGQRLVRVFDGTDLTQPPIASFRPYQTQAGDSIRVAAVDIDADGDLEIVTAPGSGGTDDPKVFDLALNPDEVDDFFATDFDFTGGFFVAAGG